MFCWLFYDFEWIWGWELVFCYKWGFLIWGLDFVIVGIWVFFKFFCFYIVFFKIGVFGVFWLFVVVEFLFSYGNDNGNECGFGLGYVGCLWL